MARIARARAVCVAVAISVAALGTSGGAMAQVLSPHPAAGNDPAPTPSMTGLFRVEKENTWDVTLALKAALFSPRTPDDTSDPNSPVLGATFAMPWVCDGATQRSQADSVSLRGWLGGMPMPAAQRWLATNPGMQKLRALVVSAPERSQFSFESMPQNASDLMYLQRPAYAGKREGLYVQLEMRYVATCRKAILDEDAAFEIGWPAAWPPEAQGTFDKQMFLDLAVDPWSGQVYEFNGAPVAGVAKELLAWGGLRDAKDIPPAALAKGLARQVLPAIKPFDDGLLPICDEFGRNIRKVDATGLGAGLPAMQKVFMGVDVRDVISVLRDGYANQAERAMALAAIYRKVGLPARVMIGYEAAADDEKEVLQRRLADVPRDELKNGPNGLMDRVAEADKRTAEEANSPQKKQMKVWFRAPPIKWGEVKKKVPQVEGPPKGTKWARTTSTRTVQLRPPTRESGGGSRQVAAPPRKIPSGPQVPRPPATTAPGNGQPGSRPRAPQPQPLPTPKPDGALPNIDLMEFESRAAKSKRMRFWVEFALFDKERGLAWVPVDPGVGGFDWHFGWVEGSERIVVLGTNFWPQGTELVDRLGDPMRSLECLKRDWADVSGDVPPYWTDGLPAALWGFWSEPGQAHAHWQELGFDACRTSVRGGP
ncbi:MAG: hypothetical protein WC718_02375 [Phycisphaerales bacterium]|jgi:hypothetical protein